MRLRLLIGEIGKRPHDIETPKNTECESLSKIKVGSRSRIFIGHSFVYMGNKSSLLGSKVPKYLELALECSKKHSKKSSTKKTLK